MHAFTDPEATAKGEKFSLPLKYDAAADQDSWQKMQVFLKTIFK
jgi:dienelactone hydrolase